MSGNLPNFNDTSRNKRSANKFTNSLKTVMIFKFLIIGDVIYNFLELWLRNYSTSSSKMKLEIVWTINRLQNALHKTFKVRNLRSELHKHLNIKIFILYMKWTLKQANLGFRTVTKLHNSSNRIFYEIPTWSRTWIRKKSNTPPGNKGSRMK